MATSPRRFDGERKSPPASSDDEEETTQKSPPRNAPATPTAPNVAPPVVVSRVLEVGPPLIPRQKAVSPGYEVAPQPRVPPPPLVPQVTPPVGGFRSQMPTQGFDAGFFDSQKPPPMTSKKGPPPLPSAPAPRPPAPSSTTAVRESLWDSTVESIMDDVEKGFGAILGEDAAPGQSARPPSLSGGLTDARALFAQLAAGHVRNVRDFMIELETGQATAQWIPICEPAIRSVRLMASQLELSALCGAMDAFATALLAAGQINVLSIDSASREKLKAAYLPLTQMMPQAFALGNQKSQREGIIVQSLLLQVDGVRKVTIDKLYLAGLMSLEMLFVAKPDEIALTSGIEISLAEKITQRFRDYKKELETAPKDESRSAEKQKLGKLAAELKSAHVAYEQAEADDDSNKKKASRKARESAVLEIKVLLARLGEIDRLQKIEKLPFGQKVTEIEAYLEEASRPSP